MCKNDFWFWKVGRLFLYSMIINWMRFYDGVDWWIVLKCRFVDLTVCESWMKMRVMKLKRLPRHNWLASRSADDWRKTPAGCLAKPLDAMNEGRKADSEEYISRIKTNFLAGTRSALKRKSEDAHVFFFVKKDSFDVVVYFVCFQCGYIKLVSTWCFVYILCLLLVKVDTLQFQMINTQTIVLRFVENWSRVFQGQSW